jgi:tetratricopeptide (TPR) repeat protein
MKEIQLLLIVAFTGLKALALTTTEKEKIVRTVYDKIWASTGNPEDKPKFYFDTKQTSMVAYMMNDKDGFPMIGFEEKAFDICASLGNRRDDAIAYLIGHEITHHNMKHQWGRQFTSAYSITNLGKTIRGIDSDGIVRFETQADERGGILSYLAGFNTSGLGEKLLTAIYDGYGIQDGPRYPTRQERIQIAKMQDSIVSTYIKVFEAGNYSALLKEYDVAISCYEYVIGKSFHSREIYNNLGVIYFLKGLDMADMEDIRFIYPVEIDLESRITRGGTKGFGDDVRSTFEKALEYFEKAAQFDKSYSTALLNKSCALTVLEQYTDAEYWSKKAIELATKEGRTSVLNNSKLVLALVHEKNSVGDKNLSKKLFDELVAQGHDYAILNKAIIEGTPLESLTFTKPLSWSGDNEASIGSAGIARAELIDGLRDFSAVELTEEIRVAGNDYLQIGDKKTSVVLVVPFKNSTMIFHYTQPEYTGQMSKGPKLGASEKDLTVAYGAPNVILPSRQGWIYLYSKNKMMVFLNEGKTISKWVVYSEY